MNPGYLALILHAHLPYVRHPEHEYFLEETWLYEAITETYIPLLWMMETLTEEKVDFRLTMSITPTLLAMFNDDLLRRRYARHLDLLCELAEKETVRTRTFPDFQPAALMYRERFARAREHYSGRWRRDLAGAFRRMQDAGKLEVLASAATHGFLPLLRFNPAAVRAQILVGVQYYHETMGRHPAGIWLPECGYYPGLEEVLKDAGLRYFVVDTHALPGPAGGSAHTPFYCPNGTATFARDLESSKQVWSSVEGYPGDFDYREFYRDIGFDLEFEYIRPYIHPDGIRVNTGIKYYRITGATDDKAPYVPERARRKAELHAADFLSCRERQAASAGDAAGRPPIITAPYDAELFGHWWFEGPDWLEALIRRIARRSGAIRLGHPSEYLDSHPLNQVALPGMSSWGYQGYSNVWLNGANDWIYRHLHAAADRMEELAERFPEAAGAARRALNQAARELLLAQSSDWAFIMTRNTAAPYAVQRTKGHLLAFNRLYEMLGRGMNREDAVWLEGIESRNNIFPDLDYRVWRGDYRMPPPLSARAGD